MSSSLLPGSAFDPLTVAGGAQSGVWPTLLIVDSDTEMTRSLVCFFEKRGFHVAAGASLAEAQEYIYRRKNWTLIIADYHLPDATGAELCDWLHAQQCASPVIFMSGSPHCATLCAGLNYLPKPFPIERLEAYIRTVRRG